MPHKPCTLQLTQELYEPTSAHVDAEVSMYTNAESPLTDQANASDRKVSDEPLEGSQGNDGSAYQSISQDLWRPGVMNPVGQPASTLNEQAFTVQHERPSYLVGKAVGALTGLYFGGIPGAIGGYAGENPVSGAFYGTLSGLAISGAAYALGRRLPVIGPGMRISEALFGQVAPRAALMAPMTLHGLGGGFAGGTTHWIFKPGTVEVRHPAKQA